jgi:hypothetical protein
MPNCIVCKTPNTTRELGPDLATFDCPRCGSFSARPVRPSTATIRARRPSTIANACGSLRKANYHAFFEIVACHRVGFKATDIFFG